MTCAFAPRELPAPSGIRRPAGPDRRRPAPYIEQFLAELTRLAPQIADVVLSVQALGAERAVRLAASADEAPVLDEDPARAREPTVSMLLSRWQGLAVLDRVNEKRFRRVNRSAGLWRSTS